MTNLKNVGPVEAGSKTSDCKGKDLKYTNKQVAAGELGSVFTEYMQCKNDDGNLPGLSMKEINNFYKFIDDMQSNGTKDVKEVAQHYKDYMNDLLKTNEGKEPKDVHEYAKRFLDETEITPDTQNTIVDVNRWHELNDAGIYPSSYKKGDMSELYPDTPEVKTPMPEEDISTHQDVEDNKSSDSCETPKYDAPVQNDTKPEKQGFLDKVGQFFKNLFD